MPSTTAKTLGAYSDCTELMQRALARGGVRAAFPTRGKAINFRQRCYKARALLLEAAAAATLPGQVPSTPFDPLFIQIDPEEGEKDEPAALLFRVRRFEGLVEDLNENTADPLAKEAEALRARLTFD